METGALDLRDKMREILEREDALGHCEYSMYLAVVPAGARPNTSIWFATMNAPIEGQGGESNSALLLLQPVAELDFFQQSMAVEAAAKRSTSGTLIGVLSEMFWNTHGRGG